MLVLSRAGYVSRLFDYPLNLLSYIIVSLPSFVRCKLECCGSKSFIVAFGMAAKEFKDLTGGGHWGKETAIDAAGQCHSLNRFR